jgi:ABC-type sugar transport system ATPase subunit
MSDIVFTNIKKRFGLSEVIRGVSMSITKGEFIVFVGPSGCGKSTLLRLVAGLEEITSGTLAIAGRVVNDIPPAERGIAMVFQSYALYPHMTAFENMAFGLRQTGADRGTIDQRVRETAHILHIEDLLARKPKQLSGGQRQRVAIGRAIVRKPSVFLFDEPLSNLDASLRVQMRIEIAKLHKQLGATMVYVTHDQAEAMTLADRIVVLRSGIVEQMGTPMELYHHPANQFVGGFIGSPQMNFLESRVVESQPGRVKVSLEHGTGEVTAMVQPDKLANGTQVVLGIRPEHIRLTNDGDGLEGVVDYVEQLGDSQFAYVRTAGHYLLTVRLDSQVKASLGGKVRIEMPPADCHVFLGDSGKSLNRGEAANTKETPLLGC